MNGTVVHRIVLKRQLPVVQTQSGSLVEMLRTPTRYCMMPGATRNLSTVSNPVFRKPHPFFHSFFIKPSSSRRGIVIRKGRRSDSSLMTDIHGKIPRLLKAQQCRVLLLVELEVLRLVDGRLLPIFGAPLDLRATVLAFPLVVEVELDERFLSILRATGHGVGLDGERLVVGEEVDDAEVAGVLGVGYERKRCVDSCGENQGHKSQDEGGTGGRVGHFGIVKEV